MPCRAPRSSWLATLFFGLAAMSSAGAQDLLVDQQSSCIGEGVASQDFIDLAATVDTADDFLVPVDEEWTITAVNGFGFFPAETGSGAGPVISVNVVIWTDTPEALPGTEQCSYYGRIPEGGLANPNFTVELDPPCVLTSGYYWAQVQPTMPLNQTPPHDGYGQWLWYEATNSDIPGFAIRDATDLLGLGCTEWSPSGSCLATKASDLCFSLVGTGGVQTDIFSDGFEIGHPFLWSNTIGTTDVRETCSCYYSSDCASGMVCDYGPGGPAAEDICSWVDGKPGGVVGGGCDQPHVGPWGGPICDGVCVPATRSTLFAGEDPALLSRNVELWGEAMLAPAALGGGEIDPGLVAEAVSMPLRRPQAGVVIGRHVGSLLALTADPGFADQICHQESGDSSPEWFVDLSGDVCSVDSGRATVGALRSWLLEGVPVAESLRDGPTCSDPAAHAPRIADFAIQLCAEPTSTRSLAPTDGSRPRAVAPVN